MIVKVFKKLLLIADETFVWFKIDIELFRSILASFSLIMLCEFMEAYLDWSMAKCLDFI